MRITFTISRMYERSFLLSIEGSYACKIVVFVVEYCYLEPCYERLSELLLYSILICYWSFEGRKPPILGQFFLHRAGDEIGRNEQSSCRMHFYTVFVFYCFWLV